MKNSQVTFQRMMNKCLHGLEGVGIYVDDIVIYSNSWSEHLKRLKVVFYRLAAANLTVNLAKSDFGHAKVIYLGHVVGMGNITLWRQGLSALLNILFQRTEKVL